MTASPESRKTQHLTTLLGPRDESWREVRVTLCAEMKFPFPDPLASPDARFEEFSIEVEAGVRLRVLSWTPINSHSKSAIVFVAGLVSIVEGWIPVLAELVKRYPVYYVETREKNSAHIKKTKMQRQGFTVQRFAEDLINAVRSLPIDIETTILIGSSLGANTIIEAMKNNDLVCRAAFVIGPNIEFAFPLWGRVLMNLPAYFYHPIKYLVLWYLRHFRVNTREDPSQMARYDKTIREAHPQRIKMLAQALTAYTIWPDLEGVQAPVAVAYAANDILHGQDEVQKIVSVLPHGCAIECPTNTYMHLAPVVDDFERFLASIL